MFSLFFDCYERLIRVVECEFRNIRTDAEVMSNLEKVACILPGHIGNAADLPLTPEQSVVVEGRHMIEMNGVDGNHATLPQTRKGADYHFSAGRECDRTVEHHGRLFIFFANPCCAKRSRKFPMRFTSGYDINLAFPRLQNGDRQAGGTAKPKESDSLSLCNAGNS